MSTTHAAPRWAGTAARVALGAVWAWAAVTTLTATAASARTGRPGWPADVLDPGLPVLEIGLAVLLLLGLSRRLTEGTGTVLLVLLLADLVAAGLQAGRGAAGTVHIGPVLRDAGLLAVCLFSVRTRGAAPRPAPTTPADPVHFHVVALLDADSDWSARAANALYAAGTPAAFLALRRLLYAATPRPDSPAPTDDDLVRLAAQARSPSVGDAVRTGLYAPYVARATERAVHAGVTGAPAVRVNGVLVPGPTRGTVHGRRRRRRGLRPVRLGQRDPGAEGGHHDDGEQYGHGCTSLVRVGMVGEPTPMPSEKKGVAVATRSAELLRAAHAHPGVTRAAAARLLGVSTGAAGEAWSALLVTLA